MNMQTLCDGIALQAPVKEAVMEFDATFDYAPLEASLSAFCDKTAWKTSYAAIKACIGDDPNGFRILTVMLHRAASAWEDYQAKGIEESVYWDTMKCFPRFIQEVYHDTGTWCFDRSSWTCRQIGLYLFRIGTLEYELDRKDGKPMLSVHIPTDVDLHGEAIDASLEAMYRMMARCYPGTYDHCPVTCHSWLLSPVLKELLPEDSRILAFQRRFEPITPDFGAGESVLRWVFHTTDAAHPETFPEHTSLQRKMKQRILAGGKIGCGFGVMPSAD